MAKRWTYFSEEKHKKKTSIGRNHSRISTSSMNKRKRQSYKKYRGQGNA